jgi:hypothetical protein
MRARARTPPEGDPFVLAQNFLCLSARSDTGCVRSIRFFAARNAVFFLGTFSAADSHRDKVIPAVICYNCKSALCRRPPGATMFQKKLFGVEGIKATREPRESWKSLPNPLAAYHLPIQESNAGTI